MDDFPLSQGFLERYRLRARKRSRAAQVGAHLVRRMPGSIGQCATPARVFKGMKLP